MKLCDGKIIELDPNKWYWLIIKRGSRIDFRHIKRKDGMIYFCDELDDIEFVENPDRIKGIIVKEF